MRTPRVLHWGLGRPAEHQPDVCVVRAAPLTSFDPQRLESSKAVDIPNLGRLEFESTEGKRSSQFEPHQ